MINTDPATIVRNKTSATWPRRNAFSRSPTRQKPGNERVKLAAAYRIIARHGLDDGIAGHISLRVPVRRLFLGQSLRQVVQRSHGREPGAGQREGRDHRRLADDQPGRVLHSRRDPPRPARRQLCLPHASAGRFGL